MKSLKKIRSFKKFSDCSFKEIHSSSPQKCNTSSITNEYDKQIFKAALPKMLTVLTTESDKLQDDKEVKDWIEKITYKNVGGKLFRGLTTVNAYQHFENPQHITPESLELARVAGWCVEMMHGTLVISDDIVDDATTRRGAPCWFRNPELGLRAINDVFLLQGSYLELVKLNFKNKPFYINVMEILNDTIFYTAIGQYLDCKTQKAASTSKFHIDFSEFTMDHYRSIVKYKTAYYTINFPIALGYILTNQHDNFILNQIKDLSVDIGTLFQVQDDYIDVYGDEELKGKEGNDIQEGKCTWLSIQAIQKCTPRQLIVFKTCYGSKEPAHYYRIVQLYKELKVEEMYKEYEDQQYKYIKQKIENLPSKMCPDLFSKVLNELYQRNH